MINDDLAASLEETGPWQLRLYVVGQSPKCRDALTNLRRLCDEHLPGQYDIELVDLNERPNLASEDDILAIPTLVRRSPPPNRKVIGDLSDTVKVLNYLGLDEVAR